MIEILIPGTFGLLHLEHLVLDYNGTIAIDGNLIEGVKELLLSLMSKLNIHIITADTFGKAQKNLKDIPCKLMILTSENQAQKKAEYIQSLGAHKTISIGNGKNDNLMLKASKIGIAVMQKEGLETSALLNSNIVCKSIIEAFNLLINPLRLLATLRD